MGWSHLFIHKLQRCNRWTLWMDKWFHPTLYGECIYFSMPELLLNQPCQWKGPPGEWLLGINTHDDATKWKHLPCYWPFVRGIHRSPVNSPHKGQWRGALMFSLISAWTNGWVNKRDACDLGRNNAHYDITVMRCQIDNIRQPEPRW